MSIQEDVPIALEGERVDRVVALLTGLPRSTAAELIDRGDVAVNGKSVTLRSQRLRAGDRLAVDVPVPESVGPEPDPSVAVPVVHDDEAVVVVDKPAGLVVHPGAGNPTGTLVQGLLARFPDMAGVGDPSRPGIVHRLDKGTSGLLVVARTRAAYVSLVSQLKHRTVERRYLALVRGRVASDAGLIDAPIGRAAADPTRMAVSNRGRDARTSYRVLDRFDHPHDSSLVECRLETGRTHQVRVHLAAIGHPLVGDARYRGGSTGERPFLHAALLGFDHPSSGERVTFESPLPTELAALLAAFTRA